MGFIGYIKSLMGSMKDFEEKMDEGPSVASDAGVDVSPSSAMQQTTVHGCVKVLAEAVGSLPLHFYERQPDGSSKRIPDHPLQRLFAVSPNDYQSPADLWDTKVSQMCLRGKAYYQIIRDGLGVVVSLSPLDADRTEMVRREDGSIFFLYRTEAGVKVPLRKDEVWYTWNFLGMSPIELLRNDIGMAIALGKHGGRFFANGARPDGVLNHPMTLSENAMKAIRKNWEQLYRGVDNSHKVAILQEGMTYNQLTMTAEDAQFLENRKYQKEEISSIFRVPMHMLNSLDRATFSNIEQQDLGFVKHTVRPWLNRIEQSVRRDLIPAEQQDKVFAQFNLDAILRGELKSQMDAFRTGIECGVLNRNEARAIIDMPPYEGGSDFITPMNMAKTDAENEPEKKVENDQKKESQELLSPDE